MPSLYSWHFAGKARGGGGAAGGGDLPSWAQGASGTITVISSGTTVASAATAAGAANSTDYPGDSENLCAPWCGGALVDIGGVPYQTVEGGGHTDGSWNGILKWGPCTGAGSNSPVWSVWLSASDPSDVVQNTVVYTDGRQSATHTYNALVGVGSSLYEMETVGYGGPGSETLNIFRVDDGTPPTMTAQDALADNISTSNHGNAAYYNGKIYYIGGNGDWDVLRVYNIAGDSWTSEANADVFLTDESALAIDSTRGKALAIGNNTAYYWDLTTLSRRAVTTYTGSMGGLEYDVVRDAFVAPVENAAQIQELSASSLAAGNTPSWTTRSFTGTAPSGFEPAGIFGRFRYVPALGGCLMVPSSTSDVWFFKS
jgi:hypothetical protein